ncbi:hypothetical protein CV102_20085 [Natronococcus pandeyae]|uniref:DUF502 domain-containing protein n=1 Tax=Natronococcus pandeyae TaxID=2055836 RepID=A0A8J8TQS5_9EURY|nr:DUF502 domain-containing protein [Natronococcus pandeyae]TYL36817.1 hypothetical protein CV102_20085 [Natronococcus pandeyae]
MSSWKRDFGRGLIVLVPILVTLFIVYVLYSFVANVTPAVMLDGDALGTVLVGVNEETLEHLAGVVRVLVLLSIVALLMYGIGSLARTTIGELFEAWLDHAANRVPGLRLVYNASKSTTEVTVGTDAVQSPVKFELWDGLRMTGFKTGHRTTDGRVILFLPTAPNITTGFVLEVDPDDITELDESAEAALTRIISAGFGDATRSRGESSAEQLIDGADDQSSHRPNS